MDMAHEILKLRTSASQDHQHKDAIVVNLVIKSFTGQAYEVTGRANPPRSSSARRYSSDVYSTFRFVATLPLAPDQWVQILKSTHQRLPDFHSSHPREVYQAVAEAMVRGDLALYQLPSLSASHGLAGKKGFGLSIIKGPNPHSATDLTPEAIKGADAAQQLLDELGISSEVFLGYLTNENLFNGEQKKNAYSEALQLFASGELLAYKIPLPPKAPPAKAQEFLPVTAADRPVPLAPEANTASAGSVSKKPPVEKVESEKVGDNQVEESNLRETTTADGKRIHYFKQEDIKVKKLYGGEEYFFYVEHEEEILELAYTTVDVGESSLEFYINNQFNDNVLMKSEGFGITGHVLSKSIDLYSDDHGVPPTYLNGVIIKKNLSNFQKEYNDIRIGSPNLNEDEIAVEAVKNISFGRERIKLGYSDISVNATGKKETLVDGKILVDVPTKVQIKAKRIGENR